MTLNSVVIVAAKRTPIGAFQGNLSTLTAPELGGIILKDIAHIVPNDMNIDQIIMGCVLTAGIGQAPARQALHNAKLKTDIPAMIVNNVCGSGLKSVMIAHDMISSGQAKCVLAGGMESMTNAPYLLPGSRGGYRFGHQIVQDHMILDGLQNAYGDRCTMGLLAEKAVEKYTYDRAQQDDYATASVHKAIHAQKQGNFESEIIPINLIHKGNEINIAQDESISRLKPEKISNLKPSFKADGTITAGNASSLNDGAAGVTLMAMDSADHYNVAPLAQMIAHASVALEPDWFTLTPIKAIEKVCQKAGWRIDEVDLFEINEAFAIVPLVTIDQLKIDAGKVNIWGGACALGHPIGASGSRILVTLISALKAKNLKRGIATLCIGGGEGVAVAIECL